MGPASRPGINHYVNRADEGVEIEPDVYFGLNIDDLVTVDDNLEDGGLFRDLDTDEIDRADRIRDGLDMGDPTVASSPTIRAISASSTTKARSTSPRRSRI